MKYLKGIFESYDSNEEVKDFTVGQSRFNKDTYKVFLSLKKVVDRNWNDIKDRIIPFLIHLKKEYELVISPITTKGLSDANIVFQISNRNSSIPIFDFFNINKLIADDCIDNNWTNHDINDIILFIKNEKQV